MSENNYGPINRDKIARICDISRKSSDLLDLLNDKGLFEEFKEIEGVDIRLIKELSENFNIDFKILISIANLNELYDAVSGLYININSHTNSSQNQLKNRTEILNGYGSISRIVRDISYFENIRLHQINKDYRSFINTINDYEEVIKDNRDIQENKRILNTLKLADEQIIIFKKESNKWFYWFIGSMFFTISSDVILHFNLISNFKASLIDIFVISLPLMALNITFKWYESKASNKMNDIMDEKRRVQSIYDIHLLVGSAKNEKVVDFINDSYKNTYNKEDGLKGVIKASKHVNKLTSNLLNPLKDVLLNKVK